VLTVKASDVLSTCIFSAHAVQQMNVDGKSSIRVSLVLDRSMMAHFQELLPRKAQQEEQGINLEIMIWEGHPTTQLLM